MTLFLAFSSNLTERVLVAVALVSWGLCVLTVIQSSREVRGEHAQKKRAQSRDLDPIFVAPDALTSRGLILRRRLILFGIVFVISVLYLAALLARPKANPVKTSSVVSFRFFRG